MPADWKSALRTATPFEAPVVGRAGAKGPARERLGQAASKRQTLSVAENERAADLAKMNHGQYYGLAPLTAGRRWPVMRTL
jgi:hypothetical protein